MLKKFKPDFQFFTLLLTDVVQSINMKADTLMKYKTENIGISNLIFKKGTSIIKHQHLYCEQSRGFLLEII